MVAKLNNAVIPSEVEGSRGITSGSHGILRLRFTPLRMTGTSRHDIKMADSPFGTNSSCSMTRSSIL